MKADLIVQNFGPIKSVNLDLRNVNVFIGPQASGKSALAKVYTICKSPLSFFKEDATDAANVSSFKKKLEEYNIGSFIKEDTFIEFSSELHYFKFERDSIVYKRKLYEKIEKLKEFCKEPLDNKNEILEISFQLCEKFFLFSIGSLRKILGFEGLLSIEKLKVSLETIKYDEIKLNQIIEELLAYENDFSLNPALYIPSERNFILILMGSVLNLLNNNVPIPKHILTFGAELEKAHFIKKEIELEFIQQGMSYKFEDGEEKIYFEDGQSIKLLEAASGIQTVLPLLLPILSRRENSKIAHYSFVIEEPELNLFPKAQYSLIKMLEKDRFEPLLFAEDVGTIHTYTTHSPYVLSSFNNLLYAYKVRNKIFNQKMIELKEDYRKVSSYLEENFNNNFPAIINPENFSAYQISNGGAEQILNRETGLIDDNFIDQASDEMGDDFDKLMELMETETA